jgi:hypothetical protein
MPTPLDLALRREHAVLPRPVADYAEPSSLVGLPQMTVRGD